MLAAGVFAAGAALARLHGALMVYPAEHALTGTLPKSRCLQATLNDWLGRDHDRAPRGAITELKRLFVQAPSLPPIQLVHGDFRSANLLCKESSVLAILDFDDVRLDHAVADLAQAAVLLGTLFHDWGPISSAARAGFIRGYESVRPLGVGERHWLHVLALWHALRMIPAEDDPTGWASAAVELARSDER